MAKYFDISPKLLSGKHIGYDTVTDIDAIKNSLKNLFTIRKGEVPGKPWLGSPLTPYLFDNIGFFEERTIETVLMNTLEKYEPRVRLINIEVKQQQEYNSLYIVLNFIVYINNNEVFESLTFSLAHNTMTTIQTRTA